MSSEEIIKGTNMDGCDSPQGADPDPGELIRELKAQNEALLRLQTETQAALGRYADLYDFAPLGYFSLGRGGDILQVNLMGAGLLGMEPEKLIDLNFGSFVQPGFSSNFDAFLGSIFSGHGRETCEISLLKKDHEPIWAHIEAAFSDASHVQGSCQLVVNDITEHKRAETIPQARLRITGYAEKNSLVDLLQYALDELCVLTSSPIGFFHYVEPDQKTLWLQTWSTRTLKEMCTAEGSGRHYDIDQAGVWVDCVREGRPVIHNDYAGLPASRRKGLPEGHAPVVREMVFPILRNRKIVAIIGVGNKAFDYTEDDLSYASRLADLIWDIAERKRAESQREAALAALRASEERYHSILEDQTELICRYLPDGRLSYVNEAYARYYGETAQKLINTNFLPHIPEPDISTVLNALARITLQDPVVVYEHRIINSAGEIHWQRWTHRGIYDAEGNLTEHQAVGRDITERRKAEEALRASEERFRYVLENVQDAVWSADLNGQFNFLSPVMARIYGRPLEEMMVDPDFWVKSSHPDDRGLVLASAESLLRDKRAAIEYRILLPDGTVRWIADRKFILQGASNQPAQLVGIVSDITARKQAEEQIQFLAKFPSENPSPLLRVARDGALLYINEAGLKLLQEWKLKVGEIIPDLLRGAVSRSMEHETTQTLDLPHGSRLFAFYIAPIVSSGYANLYCHDITESRQVRALQDAEARYHVLFDQSPYGILLVDPETGTMIEANEITSRQLGYTPAEFAGLKIADYEAAEDPEQVMLHLQKIVSEGSDDFETLHRTKSGELRNVHVWVKKLSLDNRVYFYTIYQDITERKRMEEANDEYSREIALLEERQRIAGDLHDAVSQTLFSARLTAEALLRQPERQSDSFTRSLTDLDRLVRSAGAEIRLIFGELRTHALLNVNLNTLLTNLIDSALARTNASIDLQYHLEQLVLPPNTKLAFYRIAQEAITNAIKHGRPGNIHCSVRENGGSVEMVIADDGLGFSLDNISDDHFGLQIMRERADQAGITLAVDSTPGMGTSVTVCWKEG